jgi:hypothetical protein
MPLAYAADGPLSSAGPYQYDLRINFSTPINSYSTYGEFYNETGTYENGRAENRETTNEITNVQRYTRLFTIPGIPNIGFAVSGVLTFIGLQRTGLSDSGMADPLIMPFMMWIKPNENSTIGISDYIQFPAGGTDFTSHDWQNWFVPFFNYNLNFNKHASLNFDDQFGLVSYSDANFTDEPSVDPGREYFTTLRVAYKDGGLFSSFHPFLAFDYVNVAKSTVATGPLSGRNVDQAINSGELTGLSPYAEGNDLALGAGLQYRISPRYEVNASFRYAVVGDDDVPKGPEIYYHFNMLF